MLGRETILVGGVEVRGGIAVLLVILLALRLIWVSWVSASAADTKSWSLSGRSFETDGSGAGDEALLEVYASM